MIVTVEVGLALTRPPKIDRTVWVTVAVNVVDFNIAAAEREAQLVAVYMAMVGSPLDNAAGHGVVMPVRTSIVDISEV